MDIKQFIKENKLSNEEKIANLESDIKILTANRAKTSKPKIIREIDSSIHAKQKSILVLKENEDIQSR